MKVRIENATVSKLSQENVQFRNGEWHVKQNVELRTNGSRGVQLDGVEVWDDNVGKLGLKEGDTVSVDCALSGRVWGGRWSYTLIAYNAEQGDSKAAANAEQETPASNDPF